ncbi:MAG: hypothetical protein EXR60_05210 [Dehalococcoidia bacterium]|nr:hypothetical protein [Dehalococcoidia bacterium]
MAETKGKTGEDEALSDPNEKPVEGAISTLEGEMGWELLEDEKFMILYRTSPTEQGDEVRNETARIDKSKGNRKQLINGLRSLMNK